MIELLTIGTECLDGRILNSNEQWISGFLDEHGFSVQVSTTVVDDLPVLESVLRTALGRAKVLICTGGLGPTEDDRTREAVAHVTGMPLVQDQAIVEQIRHYYSSSKREMPLSSTKQATFPQTAQVLKNPLGTAPGFYLQHHGVGIMACPGVPSEMKQMMQDHVLPILQQSYSSLSVPKWRQYYQCVGIGEAAIMAVLSDLYPLPETFDIRFQVSFPDVSVILFHQSNTPEHVTFAYLKEQLDQRFAPYAYSNHSRPHFFEYFVSQLKKRGHRVALAESCTGGLISHLISSISGASEVFDHAVISYSNRSKASYLSVDSIEQFGAVSEETALQMVTGIFEGFGVDIAVSVTGIAGPNGSEHKPVGLVFFGVASTLGYQVHQKQFSGQRLQIQRQAAVFALKLILEASDGLS